jgi:hypothetical protein
MVVLYVVISRQFLLSVTEASSVYKPHLLDNGKSLFAMLTLGGHSFKQVLDLCRKSRLNWGVGRQSILGPLSRDYGYHIHVAEHFCLCKILQSCHKGLQNKNFVRVSSSENILGWKRDKWVGVCSMPNSLGRIFWEFVDFSVNVKKVVWFKSYCDIIMLNLIKVRFLGGDAREFGGKLPSCLPPPPLDETLFMVINFATAL